MEINGQLIDLEKIGISFTPNDEQIAALEHLIEFLHSNCLTTVLSGSAGTGKTSIVRIFLEYIKKTSRRHVTLAAPTHKAKMVLSRLSNNNEAVTLHTLLKLRPDVNLLEFDVNDLQFMTQFAADLFEDVDDLIIVDEGSMINDTLYDLLVDRMNGMGKVIFIGDTAQIQPVKQGYLSKVFTATDYPGIHLTKVERQKGDNPLMDTLVKLRDKPLRNFYSAHENGIGLEVFIDTKDFITELKGVIPPVRELVKQPFKNKILAYTNSRVRDFNKLVRRILKVDKTLLTVGEIIMGYDSYNRNNLPILYNGSEYVVVRIEKTKKELPYFTTVPGYLIKLLDTVEAKNKASLNVIKEVFLIDPHAPHNIFDRLSSTLENMRLSAVQAKSPYSRKTYWASWYKLQESFITMHAMVYQGRTIRKKTIDYGYAITTHKSQGSTYENVFIDMKNIQICTDKDELRQLQYVALSRASKKVNLLN